MCMTPVPNGCETPNREKHTEGYRTVTGLTSLDTGAPIRDEEVAELEGLFRHIYRKDSVANALNIQKGFKKAKRVRVNDLAKWHAPS